MIFYFIICGSTLHKKYQTPYVSTLLVGLLVALIAAFVPIGIITQMANIGTLSAFVASAIGVIVLRRTQPDLNRPFRVPLVPFLPIVSVLFSAYLMFNLPRITWLRFIVWIVLGLFVYYLYSRKHSLLAEGRAAHAGDIAAVQRFESNQPDGDRIHPKKKQSMSGRNKPKGRA